MLVTANEIQEYELGEKIRKIELLDEEVKSQSEFNEALTKVFGKTKRDKLLIDFGPNRTFEEFFFKDILGGKNWILDAVKLEEKQLWKERAESSNLLTTFSKIQSVSSLAEEKILQRFGVSAEESHQLDKGLKSRAQKQGYTQRPYLKQINTAVVLDDSLDLEDDSTD